MAKLTHPLDVQLLSTYVAIADLGGFARAADTIGRSPAAVSMQMKRLEEAVGPPALFVREGRKMRLTERGELFLGYARGVLRAHQAALDMLYQTMPSKPIRLGAPEDYSPLLPPILAKFRVTHPTIEVELHCEPSNSLTKMMAQHAIDLALITRQDDDCRGESLRREPLVWVVGSERKFVRNERLQLAVFQPGCQARKITIEALTTFNYDFDIAFSSPSVSGIIQAVRSGPVIASLARCSVPDDLYIVDPGSGLPQLPKLDLVLLQAAERHAADAVDALTDAIRTTLCPTGASG